MRLFIGWCLSFLSPSRKHQDSKKEEEKKKPHIKKPLNAFMLYMKEMRAKVVAECTLKESAAINQILGRRVGGSPAGRTGPEQDALGGLAHVPVPAALEGPFPLATLSPSMASVELGPAAPNPSEVRNGHSLVFPTCRESETRTT